MQANVLSRVTIAASQAAVFNYLKNLKYHHLWNPALLKIDPIMTLQRGSVYKTQRVVLGRRIDATNTVTKFVNNKELELQNTTGTVHYTVNYSLATKSGKTILICDTSVEAHGPGFAFAKPVLELLARRELQADLQALKLAVEHNLK